MESSITPDLFISSNPEAIRLSVDVADRRAAYTEYRISVKVGSIEFTVLRRYKEFESFDSSLKNQFPRVQLPSFPSKITFYNKVEYRRKSFQAYLEGVLNHCRTFTPMPKETLMRALASFLDVGTAEVPTEDLVKLTPRKSEESKTPRTSLVDEVHVKPKSGSKHGYV